MILIPARPNTSLEINREIFPSVILLLQLIQEGLLSVTSESMYTEYWLTTQSKLSQEKKLIQLTDRLNMTTAVDWDVKPQTKQTLSSNKGSMGERFQDYS